MTSVRECRSKMLFGQNRANRYTRPQAFGKSNNIRFDTKMLISKHFTGTTDTGLHLIKNQREFIFVTQLARFSHEFGRRFNHPTFALYRFQQYSDRLLTYILLKRSEEHTSELQSRGHLVC